MDLLERSELLGDLESLIETARGGRGAVVAIGGEAGIGKTSVVEALRARVSRARFLVGACDSLTTPRPLGPLHDIAVDPASGMARPLADGRPRHEVFDALLDELRSSLRPAVVVLEDVHWADEATLDLIRFVGRRIADTHGVVVLTYRDDEVGPRHPLTAVLGDLATARRYRRFTLEPLSVDAVRTLAEGGDVDPERLHALTDGNPFFVTEVLAAGASDVPASVADAVLARVGRLPEASRRLVDAVSVIPDRAPNWLVQRLTEADEEARRRAIEGGLLVPYGDGLHFRHDLARRAVEAALDPDARLRLHRHAVAALESPPVGGPDPAQLAHHADLVGDGPRVAVWGRIAAEEAFGSGSYREAYDHARRVLRFREELGPAEQSDMLEQLGVICRIVDRPRQGVEALEEARALREAMGDPLALGGCLTELSHCYWLAGDGLNATTTGDESVALLEPLGPTRELGYALATRAHLAMLQRRARQAIDLGEQAVALAERFDDIATVARALNAVGAAKVVAGRPGGEEDLLRSVELSGDAATPWQGVSALGNLGSGFGEVRDYGRAARYLEQTIDEATRYDSDLMVDYARAWQARVHFEQGRWGVAALTASKALRREAGSPIVSITALTVLGRVASRRGESDADQTLAVAWEQAETTGDVQRTWPVAAGLAEAAWLRGDLDRVPGIVGPILDFAGELGVRWAIGELAYWMWRAGALEAPPDGAAEPYALQMAGDWRAAAEAWRVIGCPYEEADALADGDDEARLAAIRIWDELGAGPAPARVRSELRSRGVSVPRGPRPTTAENPAGLTARQAEVLGLLAEGMSNAAIAERLFISPKTVDHHVSAILARLGVASRGEAAAEAHRSGLLDTQ
jgi:DNA-binding CsgD family transcriptional regulator/tetratricopeptide (TPR) repeat protein